MKNKASLRLIIIFCALIMPSLNEIYAQSEVIFQRQLIETNESSNIRELIARIANNHVQTKTIVITKNEVVNDHVIIDEGINLIVMEGARFIKKGKGKLTIKGNFQAPLCQVFSGFSPGEIIFHASSVKEVYPQWWGAKHGVDSTSQIQSAMDSLNGGGRVYFTKGVYLISKTLRLPSNISLIGEAIAGANSNSATLKLADGTNSDLIRNYSYPDFDSGISIESLLLLGNKKNNIRGNGVNFKKVDWLYCNKLWVLDFPETGIILDAVNAAHLDNCRVAMGGGDGLHALAGSSHTYTNFNSEGNAKNGIHISDTHHLTNYTITGYYSEQCLNGIYINGRGVNIIGGRINDCKNSDLYLEDKTGVYDISVIGLVCQTDKPRVANIFIGQKVYSTIMFNVTGSSLVNKADISKVRIMREDRYGRLSLNNLEFNEATNGTIKHLGPGGIQFSHNKSMLSIHSGILTLKSDQNVRLESERGNINLYPGKGAVIDTSGSLNITQSVKFNAVDAPSVPTSSVFLDGKDRKLKYKDNDGLIHPLY